MGLYQKSTAASIDEEWFWVLPRELHRRQDRQAEFCASDACSGKSSRVQKRRYYKESIMAVLLLLKKRREAR